MDLSLLLLLIRLGLSLLALGASILLGPRSSAVPTDLPQDYGSRQAPVPLGQTIILTKDTNKQFEVGVRYIIRGEEAWSRIRQASAFNSPPDKDKEYLLAYVVVYYRAGPPGEPLGLSAYDFAIFSGGELNDDISFVIEPEPRFSFKAVAPAFLSGWVARKVDVDDLFPLLVLGADSRGRGGYYFLLSNITPTLTPSPATALTPTVAVAATRRPVTLGPTRTPGPSRTPAPTRPPATLKPASTLPPPPAGVACPGIRLTCTQLKSCAEAYACLKAGNTRLDADKEASRANPYVDKSVTWADRRKGSSSRWPNSL